MHSQDCVHPDDISPILLEVLRDNPEKVMGWLQNESGCWEILADKAVASRRAQCGHDISKIEQRLVWDRLWWMLDQLKQQIAD
ncbi:MAG: hypothetical protein ACE5Q6_21050 [Dehalococcoidia bacterium]